jgi:hypothetical protein
MKLRNVLAAYKRIAITGAPGTGKTSYSNQVTDRPVIHTDDWMNEPWSEVPVLVKAKCEETPDSFVVEGVNVPRTLRKGLEVDAVVYLTKPLEYQSPAQVAMGKAVGTVLTEWASTHPNVPIITELTLDSNDMKRRYLTFSLDASGVTPTPQGGRRYPAKPTKAGVAAYNRGGVVVREYRPADELKRAIATLKGSPVVVLHPRENDGEVDTSNAQRLTIGHFEDPTWDEREGAACGYVVINDAETLALIDQWIPQTGGVDISCGYDSVRIPEPGVSPDGEEYDVIQTGYKFNHVAIGPRGWGRLGTDVGLTLDSNEDEVIMSKPSNATIKTKDSDDKTEPVTTPTKDDGAPAPAPGTGDTTLTPEDIAGLKQLVQLLPALNQLLNTGAIPAVPASLDAAPAVQPAPTPTLAAATPASSPETEKKTLDSKEVERIAEAAAQEGAEVRTDAVRLLGNDYSFKGKNTRQVRFDVVRSLDSNFDEKSTDAELKAAYAITVKALEKQAVHRSELADIRIGGGLIQDSKDQPEYKQLGHWVFEN